MNAMKRHTLAILAAVLAACIIIVGMTCPAALAAEQLLRANGKHYNYFLDGKPYVIGVNAESRSGKFYYCRQIESMTDYKVTETTTVENTERRGASHGCCPNINMTGTGAHVCGDRRAGAPQL